MNKREVIFFIVESKRLWMLSWIYFECFFYGIKMCVEKPHPPPSPKQRELWVATFLLFRKVCGWFSLLKEIREMTYNW